MKAFAPAKLNLRLKIIGRRPDGYHDLVSIMVPVNLFDMLVLEKRQENGILFDTRGLKIPGDGDNMVVKAARGFFIKTGMPSNIAIQLEKNIPVGAGLGGGSSDAAGTLMALNKMWDYPLSFQDMEAMALDLGADVPFFLQKGPCIARGIGEILTPIEEFEAFWYVIVMPPIHVSTGWVYDNLKLKLTKDEDKDIIQHLATAAPDIGGVLENDLESVTVTHFPVIVDIKNALIKAGAEGALMSGSGPSVFGIFKTENSARSAQKYLLSRNLGEVFLVMGIH